MSSVASKSLSHSLLPSPSSSGLAARSSNSSASFYSSCNIVGPLEALLALLISISRAAEELPVLVGTLLPYGAHHLHLSTLAHWSIHNTSNISSTSEICPSTECYHCTNSALVATTSDLIYKLEKATLLPLGFCATEKVAPFIGAILPNSS